MLLSEYNHLNANIMTPGINALMLFIFTCTLIAMALPLLYLPIVHRRPRNKLFAGLALAAYASVVVALAHSFLPEEYQETSYLLLFELVIAHLTGHFIFDAIKERGIEVIETEKRKDKSRSDQQKAAYEYVASQTRDLRLELQQLIAKASPSDPASEGLIKRAEAALDELEKHMLTVLPQSTS